MKYSKHERYIANALKRMPLIFNVIKFLYQYLNYLFYGTFAKNSNELEVEILIDPKNYGAKDAFFGYYDRPPVDDEGNVLVTLVFHDYAVLTVFNKFKTVVWQQRLDSFNYQQGCLATWIGSGKFIFNSLVDGFVRGVVVDINSNSSTLLIDSFQSASKSYYSCINLYRINKFRPEYGYSAFGCLDSSDSLLRIRSLKDHKLLWDIHENSLCELCAIDKFDSIKVNHVIFSPDDDKFLFMVRWFFKGVKYSALISGAISSKNLSVLFSGTVSHYCWLNDSSYVLWGREDNGLEGYHYGNFDNNEIVTLNITNLSRGDGHPSCVSSSSFISDTYPDKSGSITLYLKDIHGAEKVLLTLKVPFFPRGSMRTDFHPRFVPNQNLIYFDSNHLGYRCLCFIRFTP